MNTPKQLLRESHGNFTIHGSLVSRAEHGTSETTPDNGTKKHRNLAVLIFGGIALVAYPLGRALAGLPRQEFEGLGAVACALAYVGMFLSRVIRALKEDTLQAETLNHAVTFSVAQTSKPDASQEKYPATQSEPRTQ